LKKDVKNLADEQLSVMVQGNNLLVTSKAYNNFSPTELLDKVLYAAVTSLKNAGYRPPEACPICKKGQCDAYAFYKNAYTSVHKSCIGEQSGKTIEDIEDRKANGSYLTGAIGALLGTLVGAIPNFLFILFLDAVSVYLCALIPIAGYFGYRLFKGKPYKPATVIIILFSILQTFVLMITNFYVEFTQELGIRLSLTETIDHFIDMFRQQPLYWSRQGAEELSRAYGSNMAFIMFFIILGIIFSFRWIGKTADKEIMSTRGVLDSVVDKPADV
jgi:hypothetical protein